MGGTSYHRRGVNAVIRLGPGARGGGGGEPLGGGGGAGLDLAD